MEQHNMKDLFTEMLSRNSREPAYSSKGEMLLELVNRYDIPVNEALMVGDTAEDHHAAQIANIPFAFVEYGYGELDEAVNCIRVTHFADIPKLCGCG